MAMRGGNGGGGERSMRSVYVASINVDATLYKMGYMYVGNISYGATEEQLREIFSEVGPVVSFRLMYDRQTGRPRGYGFCEFRDAEAPLIAVRDLNGFELNGRALRVDLPASEKNKGSRY